MTTGKGKRSGDPHQLIKWIVDQFTQENNAPKEQSVSLPSDLSSYMSAIGRKGGRVGGKRRLGP
jgi:hypothetical protein